MNKKCLTCGTELQKRKHESRARFEKKQFCTAEHARTHMKETGRGWWNPEFDRGKLRAKGVN